jgi:hypothetical protein
MSQKLSKKQVELISTWFNQNWTGPGSLYCNEQMPDELQRQLVQLNDHETMWQNIDRLINDLALKKVYHQN